VGGGTGGGETAGATHAVCEDQTTTANLQQSQPAHCAPKSNLRREILWWKPGSGWGRCPQTPAPAAGFRHHCHQRCSSPENSTLRTSSTVPILERTPEMHSSESRSSSRAIRTLRRRQHRNPFTQRIGSGRIFASSTCSTADRSPRTGFCINAVPPSINPEIAGLEDLDPDGCGRASISSAGGTACQGFLEGTR
jgi:hypothetical protein